MRRSVLLIVVVAVVAVVGWAVWLTVNVANSSSQQAVAETTNNSDTNLAGNSDMVGGSVLNPCAANPGLQIQPLVENGQVVEQAFMGLDLNAEEVGNGLRYVLDVPAEAYIQYFEAWSGQTWEAVGPTNVTATAWTSWCNNSGWIGQQGFPTGQHRVIDALNMPSPLGQWISRN